MYKVNLRKTKREKRKLSIKPTVVGTVDRPRLSIFRSNKYFYAQIIDDLNRKTLVSAQTNTKEKKTKSTQAQETGAAIAKKALEKGIKRVRFDRSGYKFHGRVKSFIEGVKAEGLDL